MKTTWFMMPALALALMAGPGLAWAEEGAEAPVSEHAAHAQAAETSVQKPMPQSNGPRSPHEGMMMMHRGSMMMQGAGPRMMPCQSMDKPPMLSEDKQHAVHEALQASMDRSKKLFEKMGPLQEKRHQLMIAEKFNPKAFAAVEAEIGKMMTTMREEKTKLFVKFAAGTNPDERHALAMMIEGHPGCAMQMHAMPPSPPPAMKDAAGMGPHSSAPNAEEGAKAPVEDAKPEAPSDAE